MSACASCLQLGDVRLYDVQVAGRPVRIWWCPECAFSGRRHGFEVKPAPVWIERAALRQLPVKEIPDPVRGTVDVVEAAWEGRDRRRGERRGSSASPA